MPSALVTLRRTRRLALGAAGLLLAHGFAPHVAAVTHTHAHGADTHHHADHSLHAQHLEQAARRALAGSPTTARATRAPEPTTPSAAPGPKTAEHTADHASPDETAHTHVFEPDNLAGIHSESPREAALSPEPVPVPASMVAAPRADVLAAAARAPPRA